MVYYFSAYTVAKKLRAQWIYIWFHKQKDNENFFCFDILFGGTWCLDGFKGVYSISLALLYLKQAIHDWRHCSCICKIGCMVLVTQRNWLVRLGETGPVGWDDCKRFHFGSLPGIYIFSTIWYIYLCVFGVLVQNVDFDIHVDVAYLIYFFLMLLTPFLRSDVDYRWWY